MRTPLPHVEVPHIPIELRQRDCYTVDVLRLRAHHSQDDSRHEPSAAPRRQVDEHGDLCLCRFCVVVGLFVCRCCVVSVSFMCRLCVVYVVSVSCFCTCACACACLRAFGCCVSDACRLILGGGFGCVSSLCVGFNPSFEFGMGRCAVNPGVQSLKYRALCEVPARIVQLPKPPLQATNYNLTPSFFPTMEAERIWKTTLIQRPLVHLC